MRLMRICINIVVFLTEKKIETTNMNTRPAQNTAEFKNYFFCTCTEGFLSVVKRF